MAQDFCYNNDPLATFNIPEAIRLCVVVVAFAPESVRSAQMLVSHAEISFECKGVLDV